MVERFLFLAPGVLFNLCAVDKGAEILAALPYRALVTSSACQLIQPNEYGSETNTYSAEPMINQGILEVVSLAEQNARDRFVELAYLGLRGTIGELAALASTSGGMMATDDQATTEFMASFLPEVPLLTTTALIQEYAGLANLARSRVALILTEIREHALFIPSERDPLRAWWLSHLNDQ